MAWKRSRVPAAAALVVACAATVGAHAATPGAALCKRVSASAVSAVVDAKLSGPTARASGGETSCTYVRVSSQPLVVLIEYGTAGHTTTVAAAEALLRRTEHGIHFTPVNGLGRPAFYWAFKVGSTTDSGVEAVGGSQVVAAGGTDLTLAQDRSLVQLALRAAG